MLDLKNLAKRCQNGKQFEYVLFWGHIPSKDGKITKASQTGCPNRGSWFRRQVV